MGVQSAEQRAAGGAGAATDHGRAAGARGPDQPAGPRLRHAAAPPLPSQLREAGRRRERAPADHGDTQGWARRRPEAAPPGAALGDPVLLPARVSRRAGADGDRAALPLSAQSRAARRPRPVAHPDAARQRYLRAPRALHPPYHGAVDLRSWRSLDHALRRGPLSDRKSRATTPLRAEVRVHAHRRAGGADLGQSDRGLGAARRAGDSRP